jgi:hypothetical protein
MAAHPARVGFGFLNVTTGLKIPGAVIPRDVFTQPGQTTTSGLGL